MKNVFLAIGLFILSGCYTTVEPGEVAVVVDWGKVQKWTYPEGFHFIAPVGIDLVNMSTRTQIYEMGHSGTAQANTEQSPETSVDRGEPISVLSKDQLTVTVSATVQFHLNPSAAPKVFQLYGESYADTIVHPNIRTAIRDTASNFNAIDLVDKRSELQNQLEVLVHDQIANALKSRNISQNAIVVEAVLLQNIDLPDSLDESIANVVRERQATAQREQALRTAEAEARRLRMQAEGEAQARTIRAEAEAEANRKLTASLTSQVLELRRIEATNALLSSNQTRVIMVPSSGLTMMLPTQ